MKFMRSLFHAVSSCSSIMSVKIRSSVCLIFYSVFLNLLCGLSFTHNVAYISEFKHGIIEKKNMMVVDTCGNNL